MSWHSGSWAATTAGLGISTIWDALVDGAGKWSVYDAAAGTNAKVYRCYDADENVDFYLYIKDNNTGYWDMEMWEGWNAVGHVGIGANITGNGAGNPFRCRRPVGGWYLSVLDHRVVYIDAVNWQAAYIGMPRRYDRSRNTPVIFAASSTATYTSATAYWPTGGSQVACRWLFDENRNSPDAVGDGGTSNSVYRQIMGHDGDLRLAGELPIGGRSTYFAIGTMEGVSDLGAGTSLNFSPTAGETVSIDGVDWIIFSGAYSTKYWSAVRMA